MATGCLDVTGAKSQSQGMFSRHAINRFAVILNETKLLSERKLIMIKFKFKPLKDIDNAGQTNKVRAERAEQLIREGFEIHHKHMIESVNAADLVSDIFHLCDRNGWNVKKVIQIAKANWQDER
jgi:hypothetical protein